MNSPTRNARTWGASTTNSVREKEGTSAEQKWEGRSEKRRGRRQSARIDPSIEKGKQRGEREKTSKYHLGQKKRAREGKSFHRGATILRRGRMCFFSRGISKDRIKIRERGKIFLVWKTEKALVGKLRSFSYVL